MGIYPGENMGIGPGENMGIGPGENMGIYRSRDIVAAILVRPQ